MKKQLLTLATAVAFAATSAFAFVAQQGPVAKKSEATVNGARAATADGFEINFAGSPYTAYSFGGDNCSYRCYLYITPEVATRLAGNQLTQISLSPALIGSNTLSGYIFVSEDINSEPLTSTDVTFTNSYNATSKSQTYQTHTLDNAYEIKENTGFYFGYVMDNVKYTATKKDYAVGVDNQTATPFAGYADVLQDGEVIGSIDVGEDVGSNLLLKANTIGDKKSLDNFINVTSITTGSFLMPVTDQLSGNKATVKISNLGTNKISSINYTLAVAGGESVTADRNVSIQSNRTSTISNIAIPDMPVGHGKVSFTVNKINGEEIDPISANAYYIGLLEEGYPRKFLVEEGTGTWCGWCPRGIVGFDYMETKYPDEFIGIAVHSGDEMQTASYSPLFQYITGFPGAIINRDPGFIVDPASNTLVSNYNKWQSQKGAATVSIEAGNPADGSINVTATTTFAIDDPEADYSLAFVTLEDGIMGMQTNYYAGGSSGTMGGWENKGSSVRTSYKHVARNIYNYYGLPGSIPTQVSKGEPMTFNYDLPLDNVSNVEKSSIVVLLLDNASGTVLNAAQIHADQYGISGMSDIFTEDCNAPVEYYNLQGIRMSGDNLPAGIYVTRQGNKTAKVVVK